MPDEHVEEGHLARNWEMIDQRRESRDDLPADISNSEL